MMTSDPRLSVVIHPLRQNIIKQEDHFYLGLTQSNLRQVSLLARIEKLDVLLVRLGTGLTGAAWFSLKLRDKEEVFFSSSKF
jgi:hypothetical protein